MALYTKHRAIRLKNNKDYDEKWLQNRIAEDPEILGLGPLVLLDRERRFDKAGRLDLLLVSPDEDKRFEVEIQLGQTDEGHIIRTIEYWDIERRRYPQYDHTAVLIAEDVTARFLNVLGLFVGHIPLVVLQMNALEVGNHLVIHFARIIDRTNLRQDVRYEVAAAKTDRKYWEETASPTMVGLVDKFLAIVNVTAPNKNELTYNKYYIGLQDGGRSTMFVHFRPRRNFVQVNAAVNDLETWLDTFASRGVQATNADGYLRATIAPKDFEERKSLFEGLLKAAVKDYYES